MSPETLCASTFPSRADSTRKSPETDLATIEPPTAPRGDVAGDRLHAELAADALEPDVAAHGLHDRVALDLAVDEEVAGCGLHSSDRSAAAQLHVGRGGRELGLLPCGTRARTFSRRRCPR